MKKGKLTQNKVHLQQHEYNTVSLLLEYGFDIELIPPSRIKGLRTPDMVMNGLMWEIKSPEGNGKRTIMNTVQNASHQADNIVIDLSRCKMDEDKAIAEIRHHFDLSKRIKRIIIITKDQEMIDLNKK